MNYRILMNFSILLFALLTLQCETLQNNQSISKGDIIGTWVASHTEISPAYDTGFIGYDTGFIYKTYSITFDTIKISKTYSGRFSHPIGGFSPLIGTWSLINDSLIVYHDFYSPAYFSTRYLITKYSPDSLIFSFYNGIDTCENQSN